VREDGQILGLTCMFGYLYDLAIFKNPLLDYSNMFYKAFYSLKGFVLYLLQLSKVDNP